MRTSALPYVTGVFCLFIAAGCGDSAESPGSSRDGAAASGDAGVGPGSGSDAGDGSAGDGSGLAKSDGSSLAKICTVGTMSCNGATASICADNGTRLNTFACPNGCEGAGVCKPLSLETNWKVHQFNLADDSINTPAAYSFEDNGLIAVQTANPMASVYYYDVALPEGVQIKGKFSVRTTADDDLIGFVFGWQNPENFYLFDWKQVTQDDSTCGLSTVGASLKLAKSATVLDKCKDLWASDGTEKVMPLVKVDKNTMGWKDNTDYDLVLSFRPGDIKVEIFEGTTKVVSIISTDATLRSGKFGFYNYSQENVRYEFFSISPIP